MSGMHDVLELMYKRLDEFLKTETVIGEPMEVGSLKLIPIITASFGLGGGFNESGDQKPKEQGGGGGLGCRIAPNAILVVNGDDVNLVSLQGRGSLDKLFDHMPELLDAVKELTSKSDGERPEAEPAQSAEDDDSSDK